MSHQQEHPSRVDDQEDKGYRQTLLAKALQGTKEGA
jgi:hypothetical protein